MKRLYLIFVFLIGCNSLFSQQDSLPPKLTFNADFRFRIEQDWNSQKADGTFRDDRTRLRYRVRAGVQYENKWYQFGFRLRTGNPNKQQDPHLTLGEGLGNFGTLPIGLEKAYFQGKWRGFHFWVGKNTFPFEKSNELFWSDNVYPEGVFLGKGFQLNSRFIDTLCLKGGHFILSTSGKSLDQDSYFQGFQTYLSFLNHRIELFPSLYLFKNIPNIPDGAGTYEIDYAIFQMGSRFKLLKKIPLSMTLDYYQNFEDYHSNDSIPLYLKNEKAGMVIGLKYGSFKQKGDWLFKLSYTWLQQYAAVDFMAQNDWVRWDYSSFNSPDGRLTNFNGFEFVAGYLINTQISLKLKCYAVEQLTAYGLTKETGNRVRLDLDIKF